MMSTLVFSVLITTKNRLKDLSLTLAKIQFLLERDDVECLIYDDGSADGTSEYVINNYPQVVLQRNATSKGYLYCRNKMLNQTTALYAISLDDDAHFLSSNVLQNIQSHFVAHPQCGVIACRILWGIDVPEQTISNESTLRVKGFVGCGHVWNMKAWSTIPDYPEWFIFYGEEDFASYQLLKVGWQVQYVPSILVHHRVNLKTRKKNTDYTMRQRRSLSSGWYLLFLFYPKKLIPRKMLYSIYMQLKAKVFKGDLKALQAISLALLDLVVALPKIMKSNFRLTQVELDTYNKLPDTIIYWVPKSKL